MTTRKKKKTRIFSICLIIIALLLIVGCGLYILKDKLVNTTETSNSPVVSSEVQNQSDDASAGTSSDENAEITEFSSTEKLQQAVAEISFPLIFGFVPWGHHVNIITKCKDLNEALFYIK